MSALGLVYGDSTTVDARWPRLARVEPLFGVYFPGDAEPGVVYATRAEAEDVARRVGDGAYAAAWHPRS